MNLAQYIQMWQWIREWQTKNHTKDLPNYVTVYKFKIKGVDTIKKTTYMDMYNRVQKWQTLHDGKMPEIIGIEAPRNRHRTRTIHRLNQSTLRSRTWKVQ